MSVSLNTLYAIADCLQVEVIYNEKLGVIAGKSSFTVPLLGDHDMIVTSNIKGGYVSEKESAVLVKVCKGLYLYLIAKTGAYPEEIFLKTLVLNLSSNCTQVEKLVNNIRPTTAVPLIEQYAVAKFEKEPSDKSWRKINVATMVSGQRESNQSKPPAVPK